MEKISDLEKTSMVFIRHSKFTTGSASVMVLLFAKEVSNGNLSRMPDMPVKAIAQTGFFPVEKTDSGFMGDQSQSPGRNGQYLPDDPAHCIVLP